MEIIIEKINAINFINNKATRYKELINPTMK